MPRSPAGPSRLSSYEEGWEAINRLIREGGSWSGFERKCFYINSGRGTFANASAAAGLDFIDDGRAFAVLDLEPDGDPDLILKNRSGPQVRILRNDLPSLGGRVAFRLEGVRANRDAVGARVEVSCGGKTRVRSLQCGSGFLSQSSPWLLFAFPGEERAERVVIHWPGSGRQEVRDLPLGRRWRIREGDAPRGDDLRPPSTPPPGAPAPPVPGEAAAAPPPDHGFRETWLLTGAEPPDLPLETIETGARATSPPRDAPLETNPRRPLRLAELRGSPVLVNLSSELCSLCAREIAGWKRHRDEIAASGLRLVLLEAPSGAGAAPLRSQAGGSQAGGPQGGPATSPARSLAAAGVGNVILAAASPEVLAAFGVFTHQVARWPREISVPASLLLDSAGQVVKLYRGPVEWPRLRQDLELLRRGEPLGRLGLPFPGVWHTEEPRRDHFQLGVGYVEAGLRELAAAAFRRAVEARPDDGEALYNLGVVLGQGNAGGEPSPDALAEARLALERAIALHPDFADAHSNLGVILAQAGDLPGAEGRFREALRLRPGHAEGLLNLGRVLLEGGKEEEALGAFERAAEAEPELPAPRKRLGEAYRRLGRREEARAALREAVRLDPGDAEARSNLGVLLAESGDLEGAARELTEAVRRQPRYAPGLNNLGLVELRRGRGEEAQRAFREALLAEPDLPEPYLNLARVRLSLGDREGAREVLNDLLARHPDHREARKLLQGLRRR